MAEQSGDQFRTVLARMAAVAAGTPLPPPPEGAEEPPPPPRVAVVSLSPQSRASLAMRHGLTAEAAHRKLTAFFKQLGAQEQPRPQVCAAQETQPSTDSGVVAGQGGTT